MYKSKLRQKEKRQQSKIRNHQEKGWKSTSGITLIALVITIIVYLVSYDKNRKYSNLVGFSL